MRNVLYKSSDIHHDVFCGNDLGLKQITVFLLTRPTLFFFFFFFRADPAIFMAFQKKKKRFSYLSTMSFFRKFDKILNNFRNV